MYGQWWLTAIVWINESFPSSESDSKFDSKNNAEIVVSKIKTVETLANGFSSNEASALKSLLFILFLRIASGRLN